MVNRTPLLSRRTGAGHEVDRNIRLVPGFRFIEKLHACRLPRIRQLKIRDENDETFMIADFRAIGTKRGVYVRGLSLRE